MTDLEAERAAYRNLLDAAQTLVISSLDADGEPFISYAPFVRIGGRFYVFLSQISEHYCHLVDHPRVQIMLIADEAVSPNQFARLRVRYACAVTRITEENESDAVFAMFSDRFNDGLIQLLRSLDFSLFELAPTVGRFVSGFGKAFDVDAAGTRFEHVVSEGVPPAAQR